MHLKTYYVTKDILGDTTWDPRRCTESEKADGWWYIYIAGMAEWGHALAKENDETQTKGHNQAQAAEQQTKRSVKEMRRNCEKKSDRRYGLRLIWMRAGKNIIWFYHSNSCGFLDINHTENWGERKQESQTNNFSKTKWEDTSRQFSDLSFRVIYNKNYLLFPNNVLEINYKINIFRI